MRSVPKCPGVGGNNHEFLQVDIVVRMFTAVHRFIIGTERCVCAADVLIEWEGPVQRSRLREDAGIGAQARFVGCAIQLNHHRVDAHLIQRIQAGNLAGQGVIHVFHRVQHTLVWRLSPSAVRRLHVGPSKPRWVQLRGR